MIIKDPDEKKEFDKIPDVDKNGDPIYKIDDEGLTGKSTGDLPAVPPDTEEPHQSKFKDTPQDLKDETSQD
jgi:hypothetical protein